jgi:hypothetical protein
MRQNPVRVGLNRLARDYDRWLLWGAEPEQDFGLSPAELEAVRLGLKVLVNPEWKPRPR